MIWQGRFAEVLANPQMKKSDFLLTRHSFSSKVLFNKNNESVEKESNRGYFKERLWLVERVKSEAMKNGLGGLIVDK